MICAGFSMCQKIELITLKISKENPTKQSSLEKTHSLFTHKSQLSLKQTCYSPVLNLTKKHTPAYDSKANHISNGPVKNRHHPRRFRRPNPTTSVNLQGGNHGTASAEFLGFSAGSPMGGPNEHHGDDLRGFCLVNHKGGDNPGKSLKSFFPQKKT